MCQIFTIPYRESFLANLYDNIIRSHDLNQLTNLVVLLPDQHSVVAFKTIFRNKYKGSCFLPKILALSDYRNIAKTFKLKLELESFEDANFTVRCNLINFITSLNYLELEDKMVVTQDLLKLFSEMHQGGADIKKIDLSFLGKAKDEQILLNILKDFNRYVAKHNLAPSEYILDHHKSDILYQLANKLKSGHSLNKQVILAGSSLSLFITENLARALISYKNSAIYLNDFNDSVFDLDNDFTRELKTSATTLKSMTARATAKKQPISCRVFESEYAEIDYIKTQILDDKQKVIVNSNSLRSNLTMVDDPYSYADDVSFQKYLISSFFSKKTSCKDLRRAELFKDKLFQDFIHNQEKKQNFDIFAKISKLEKSYLEQNFYQQYQDFKKLLRHYNISLDLDIVKLLEALVTQIADNSSAEELLEYGLLESYLSDIKSSAPSASFIYFSYEARLSEHDNILISGLTDQSWINQDNYNYISSDALKQFGLRSEADYQLLAIADLLILLNSKRVQLTLTDDRASDILSILYYMESRGVIKFDYVKPQVKQKKSQEPYAIMEPGNKITKMSVSEFALLLSNPYGLYVKRVLKLTNLQKIYQTSIRRVYGVIIHKVIEDYTENVSDIEISNRLEYLQNSYLKYTEQTAFKDLFGLLSKKVNNLFKWWLSKNEAISSNSNSTKVEVKYKAQIHPQIMFSAIIDRLEIYAEGRFKLVDYKTSKLPTKSEIESGIYSQLILESLIYIKANNLTLNHVENPILVQLVGDVNFVQNNITEIENFALNLTKHEDNIMQILDIFLEAGTKLYSFPRNTTLQKYSDYVHVTRKGN